MTTRLKFNLLEFAGSLGDLGTLLPIAIAMVVFNGVDPLGVFLSIGVFYLLSGLYFGITVPVQPMKAIGAYAIAAAVTPEQIVASSLFMAAFLLFSGLTGIIDCIHNITPRSVIRGVQLSTGVLLISTGVKYLLGTSLYQTSQQMVEPHLLVQFIGVIPISIVIGLLAVMMTLVLLNNKKFPAALVVIVTGGVVGLLFGARLEIADGFGLHLPQLLPFGFPAKVDFTFALVMLVLPQLPMTIGNAVLAYTDLSKRYFGKRSQKMTNRAACISMALANCFSFFFGGIPLCHGAGGLAAHYAFGARTGGSNVMIGGLFVITALLLGKDVISLFNLIPFSVLGALLIFSGGQLALAIMDLKQRKEFFVATLILGITLASNLAVGFIAGMVVAHLLRSARLTV